MLRTPELGTAATLIKDALLKHNLLPLARARYVTTLCKISWQNIYINFFVDVSYFNREYFNFNTSPAVQGLIVARFCTTIFFCLLQSWGPTFLRHFHMHLAVFVEDARVSLAQYRLTLHQSRGLEDLRNQMKGSQYCQAIKKIRSYHRSVTTHLVNKIWQTAVLFPAYAWRGI